MSEITATGGGQGSGPVFIFDLPKLLIPPNYLKTQCSLTSSATVQVSQCTVQNCTVKHYQVSQYHSTKVSQYQSITVSALVPRYHSISISINIAVSQYHRLHCTQPLRHSKGAIWAQRTGFNFCWLPLTNSYQIPLLQAHTTKVSIILPNPLCVQQQQRKHHIQAKIKDTILEIRSTSPSMSNGCEE